MKRIFKTGAVLLISAMVALALTSCDTGGGGGPSNDARLRFADVRIGGELSHAPQGAVTFSGAIEGAAYAMTLGVSAVSIDFSYVLTSHRDATLEFIAFRGTPTSAPNYYDQYSLYFQPLSTQAFGILAVPNTMNYVVIRVTAQNGTTTRYYAWRVQVPAGPGRLPMLGTLAFGNGFATVDAGFGQSIPDVGIGSVFVTADNAQITRRGAVTLTAAQALTSNLSVTATGEAGVQITGYFVAPADFPEFIPGFGVFAGIYAQWTTVTPGMSFQIGNGVPHGGHLFIRTLASDGREWFYRVELTISERPTGAAIQIGVPDTADLLGEGTWASVTLGTGAPAAEVALQPIPGVAFGGPDGVPARRGTITISAAMQTAAQNGYFILRGLLPGIAANSATSANVEFAVGTLQTITIGGYGNPQWSPNFPQNLSHNNHLFIRTTTDAGRPWYYRLVVTVAGMAVPELSLTLAGQLVTLGTGGAAIGVATAAQGSVEFSTSALAVSPPVSWSTGIEAQFFVGYHTTLGINPLPYAYPWRANLQGVTLTDGAHLFIRTRPAGQHHAQWFFYRVVVSIPEAPRALYINNVAATLGTGAGALITIPMEFIFGPDGFVIIPAIPGVEVPATHGSITLSEGEAAGSPVIDPQNFVGNVTGMFILRYGQTLPVAAGAPWTNNLDEEAPLNDGDHVIIRVAMPSAPAIPGTPQYGGEVMSGTSPLNHFYRIAVTVTP